MHILTVSEARRDLFKLVDQIGAEPVYVHGRRNNLVMLSQREYEGLLATLELSSDVELKRRLLEKFHNPRPKSFSGNLEDD